MNPFAKKDKHVDQEIFAMYDSKGGVYGAPMFAPNSFTLIREIESLFTDPAQQKNLHVTNSQDFSLFKIGEYDRPSGKITPVNATHVIDMHTLRTHAELQKLANQNAQQGATLVARPAAQLE